MNVLQESAIRFGFETHTKITFGREPQCITMRRRAYLKTAATVSATTIPGLAGCTAPGDSGTGTDDGSSGQGTTTTATQSSTSMQSQSGQTIQMVTEGSDYYFDPIGLFVEPGTTVTWNNKSGSHSATAYKKGRGSASVTRIPDGAKSWNSDILSAQGATYDYTFETTGTYDYFCIPHKSLGMVGRIIVGDPGGSAEGSMPPDGKVPESKTIVDQTVVSYNEFTG